MSHFRRSAANSTCWILAGCPSGRPFGVADARWGADTQSQQTSENGRRRYDGVGGHGAAGDTHRIERVYLDGDEAYGFTHDYNGSHLLS